MKQYFLKIHLNQTKNKAHEAVQDFARQYEKCLIDEPQFFQLVQNTRDKIAEVNKEFKRCQDIELHFLTHTDHSFSFSVESNFSFSVYEVKRYETATSGHDWGRDLTGDMKADAE